MQLPSTFLRGILASITYFGNLSWTVSQILRMTSTDAPTNGSNGAGPRKASLSIDTINKRVINSEYAVRGEIVQLAQRIARDLEEGKGSYPFDKLVWCNIGNPQILGQKPITYFRQVLALCECPQVGAWVRVSPVELASLTGLAVLGSLRQWEVRQLEGRLS